MADISLVIDVKQDGVISAVKSTKALERNVKLLSDSFKGGKLTLGPYGKGIKELADQYDRTEKELRKYANGLRRAERASAAAAAQAKLEAQARRDAAAATRVTAAAARVAAAAQRATTLAAAEAARETKRLADRQLELRMRFQEGYAQFTRQREAMRSLREAYRSGIITLQQYEAQLARIRTANQGNVRGTNNLGVAMQQTGYQVGDFMVQIQGGTNPMVAFGQQATQLVGVLYLLPPATLAASTSIMGLSVSVGFLVMSLGIIIPIATAIGAYFMRMSGSAKKLSDNLNELTSSSDQLKETFEIIEDKELDQKFGNLTDEVRSLSSAMLTLDSNAQLNNLMAFLDKAESAANAGSIKKIYEGVINTPFTGSLVGTFASAYSAFTDGAFVDEEEFAKLGYGIGREQYLDYIKGLRDAANQGNREEVVKLFSDFIEEAGDNVTTSGYKLADGFRQAAIDLAEVGALMDGSAAAAERLTEAQELYKRGLQEEIDLVRERDEAVNQIRASVDEELKDLQDKVALNKEILNFGQDSVQVATLRAAQEREAYKQQQLSKDIRGNNLNLVMDEYDAYVQTQSAVEALNSGLGDSVDLLTTAERMASRLASALDAAANAGTSRQRQIAVVQAQIEAATRGASPEVAGVRAGTEFDVGQVSSDPLISGAAGAIAAAEAAELERLNSKLRELTSTSSGESSGTTSIKDPLPELLKRLELDQRLLDVSKEREAVERAIADSDVTYSQASIDAAVKRLEAYNLEKQALEEVAATQEKIANTIENSMESAFMSMVDGTKSVKDAFKSMAAEIIKELYRIYVIKRITGMVAGAFGGGSAGMTAAPAVNPMAGMSGSQMLPQAMGGAWMKGVQMFANGGVVDSPTMFGHSAGVGVMGEAGPEAIMPLKRGANGKLGVSVEGGSGSVVVNNNINVTGGSDPAAIRMEVAKLMPQITSATKSAVIDARRRGGQMRAAFN